MNYGQLEKNLFGTKENYLKAVEKNQKRHEDTETIYNLIGYTLEKALAEDSSLVEIQWDRIILKPSTIQEIKNLLQDLKNIKN